MNPIKHGTGRKKKKSISSVPSRSIIRLLPWRRPRAKSTKFFISHFPQLLATPSDCLSTNFLVASQVALGYFHWLALEPLIIKDINVGNHSSTVIPIHRFHIRNVPKMQIQQISKAWIGDITYRERIFLRKSTSGEEIRASRGNSDASFLCGGILFNVSIGWMNVAWRYECRWRASGQT